MSDTKLYPLDEELRKTRPYAARYAQIYGVWNLMSEEWPVVDYSEKGYKTSEAVYKDCLKKGKTWKELLEYNPEVLKTIVL